MTTSPLRPPSLALRDESAVQWRSLTKVIMAPAEHWPVQLLERPIIVRRIGRQTLALVADPEAAKFILTSPQERFPRWRISRHLVGRAIGSDNLGSTDGERWRRVRHAFNPMFHPEVVTSGLPLCRAAIERAIAGWREGGNPVRLDAALEMTRLTLGITWELLFGSRPDAVIGEAAARIHAAQLRGDIGDPPRIVSELAELAAGMPRGSTTVSCNPFDRWGAAPRADGHLRDGALTWQELLDNARMFLIAGHETAVVTLTWALWLVARDQVTQQRIHDEIREVVGDGPIEEGHLGRLAFVGRVLSETLRLFPPIPVTVRQTRDAVELAGSRLPAGAILGVSFYAMHRHRDWWGVPDLFWPDRFADGEPRHHYAYLPFSAGTHGCIGAVLAWQEIMMILATILRAFHVDTDPAVPVAPRVLIPLHPDRAVPIELRSRKPS